MQHVDASLFSPLWNGGVPMKEINLDATKLLGFRLTTTASIGAKIGDKPNGVSPVIGAKVGNKPLETSVRIGAKVGSKPSVIGAKVGVKPIIPGAKIGVKPVNI
jgi:hypothetical protein